MARPVSSIGLRGEVSFGATGYLHQNQNWRGAADSTIMIGTGEPGVSTTYVSGDFVVHDGVVWIANHTNDNVPPGGAYDLAGTGLDPALTNRTYWTQVGATDTTEATFMNSLPMVPVIAQAIGGTGSDPQATIRCQFTGDSGQANLERFFRLFGVDLADGYVPAVDAQIIIPGNVTLDPAQFNVGVVPFIFASGMTIFRTAVDTFELRDQGAQGTVAATPGMFPAIVATSIIDQSLADENQRHLRFTDAGVQRSIGNKVQIDRDNFVQVDIQHNPTLEINDINQLALRISPTDTEALPNALSLGTDGVRASIATWARDNTIEDPATDLIPLNKLPNLQLGNTYTFTTIALRNASGARSADDGGPIEWHTGDLAVIAHDPTNTAPNAAADDGVYVFIGVTRTTDPDTRNVPPIDSDDFRVVVSASTQVQTTFSQSAVGTTPAVMPRALTNINYDAPRDLLEFTVGDETMSVDVNQVERIAPEAPDMIDGLINRIKIGEMVYQFGDPSPTPAFGFLPTTATINRYHAGTQTAAFGVRAIRNAADTSTNPIAITTVDNVAITGTDNTFAVTGTGASTRITASVVAERTQSAPFGPYTLSADGDLTITRPGIVEPFNNLPATAAINLRDARQRPTLSPGSITRTTLDMDTITQTIDYTPGTSSLATGTSYDIATFNPVSGTNTVDTSSFTIAPSIQSQNFTVTFPAISGGANGQEGAVPSVPFSITRFNPFFIGTAATSPTTPAMVTALGIGDNTRALSNRTNFPVTGTPGQTVFIVAPAVANNINLTVTVNGVATSANTDGLVIRTIDMPAAVGNITYTVYQFAGLDASPTTFNITIT